MEGVWSNTPSVLDNKYQYNGKELNDDFGLGWMDYGARMYDAAIGYFTSIDPLSEISKESSPYNYCGGNPVSFVDMNGLFKIHPMIAQDYPHLYDFLKGISNTYQNKPAEFKKIFKQYSEMSDADIKTVLTDGSGPEIMLGNLGETFNGQNGKNEKYETIILLNIKIAAMYELSFNQLKNLKENIYNLLESTVFHEATHYGDEQNGGLPYSQSDYDSKGNQKKGGREGGTSFEIKAYGKNWGMSDIKELLPEAIKSALFQSNRINMPSKSKSNDEDKKDKPKPPQA